LASRAPWDSHRIIIGIPVAIGGSRLIAAQLYQVKGWDPVFAGGAIITAGLPFLAKHHSGAKGNFRQSRCPKRATTGKGSRRAVR
jgi:hypothetical protein